MEPATGPPRSRPDLTGLRVIRCPRHGRGHQMNHAARHATGDMLLFHHADTELTDAHFESLRATADDPGHRGRGVPPPLRRAPSAPALAGAVGGLALPTYSGRCSVTSRSLCAASASTRTRRLRRPAADGGRGIYLPPAPPGRRGVADAFDRVVRAQASPAGPLAHHADQRFLPACSTFAASRPARLHRWYYRRQIRPSYGKGSPSLYFP